MKQLLMVYLRYYYRQHMCFDPVLSPASPLAAPLLLYIHIPFCESLCPFCTFHRTRFDAVRANRYMRAVATEIEQYEQRGFRFNGIYVGGGTPTVLAESLAVLLDALRQRHPIGNISVETNPNHLTRDRIEGLRAAGVTRLSVGVQSLDDRLLQDMGRFEAYGGRDDIMSALTLAQGQMDTFNVDMMFNFPRQSLLSILADIAELKQVGVDQISYYPLMPALSTRHAMLKSLGTVSFTREHRFYNAIVAGLSPHYERSTAWCFSRAKAMLNSGMASDGRGAVDEYIVDYDHYLGVGSGAFSYLNGCMYSSTFSINQYVRRVARGLSGITAQRRFTRQERARYELLMKLFSLRLAKSVLCSTLGADYQRLLRKELMFFKLIGALCEDPDQYYLTERGAYYWVLLMREFFMGVNTLRDTMRQRIREDSVRDLSP